MKHVHDIYQKKLKLVERSPQKIIPKETQIDPKSTPNPPNIDPKTTPNPPQRFLGDQLGAIVKKESILKALEIQKWTPNGVKI